jgi:serine protease
MATPQVAGAAALIRSARPKLSAPRVISLLKRTATSGGAGFTDELGWGILNAGRAVKAALAKHKKKR